MRHRQPRPAKLRTRVKAIPFFVDKRNADAAIDLEFLTIGMTREWAFRSVFPPPAQSDPGVRVVGDRDNT